MEVGGKHLAQQVLKRPLDELAKNPLLLTTMAIIHTRKKALPKGRAHVYEDAIQLLVRDWQQEKKGEKRVVESDRLHALLSDASRLWPTLERIAFEAHQVGGTRQEEAAGLSKEVLLKLLSPPEYLGSWGMAEEFLNYADQRAGLLVGLGGAPGQPTAFGFVHRTFQEYLAGRYVTRGRSSARNLRARAAEGDLWSLAVEFGAEALLHIDRNRQALLDLAFELATAEPQETAQWRRQILWGAKMAALVGVEVVERDRGGVVDGADFLQTVRPRLVNLLAGDLPPAERVEAGRALARLGDSRREVLTVDWMELCRVPAGRFVMGSHEGNESAFEIELPQRELEIRIDYWVGRFPVTQAQYREFVEAGGYGKERFWAEAREHGVWEQGRVKALYEEVPAAGPEAYGEPWNLGNHPAVGVSWYEALAFCRWLTERWRAKGWLPKGLEVRLPSETEWEKAARGGLKIPTRVDRRSVSCGLANGGPQAGELEENPDPARRHPWSGDFSGDRANTVESGVRTTGAVGCFAGGVSPYGCEEMAGNVWEWTRSLEGNYPYPDDPSEREAREDLASKETRVLRGGSFFYEATDARCSARNRNHPDYRSGNIGFRVSVSPFSSDL